MTENQTHTSPTVPTRSRYRALLTLVGAIALGAVLMIVKDRYWSELVAAVQPHSATYVVLDSELLIEAKLSEFGTSMKPEEIATQAATFGKTLTAVLDRFDKKGTTVLNKSAVLAAGNIEDITESVAKELNLNPALRRSMPRTTYAVPPMSNEQPRGVQVAGSQPPGTGPSTATKAPSKPPEIE